MVPLNLGEENAYGRTMWIMLRTRRLAVMTIMLARSGVLQVQDLDLPLPLKCRKAYNCDLLEAIHHS